MVIRSETGPEIRLCPRSALREAMGVLYRRVPAILRPQLINEALEDAERGMLDLSGLWIARRRNRIVGVLLTQVLAGRAAAVWAPEVALCWGRAALAAELVRRALESLRGRGVRIVQALTDSATPRAAVQALVQGGLPHTTELTYLRRDTASPLPIDPSVPRFDWRPYGPETEAAFREVLEETYIGSFDMPELEGVRSLDDIMASHRAGGRFDASRWRIGRLPDEPGAAAIVLLSEPPDRDVWEVSYLGLAPGARGRGLGRAVLEHALELARPHVPRLELAVDTRNLPAERLYRAAGFVPFDRRIVHLTVFPPPGS